MSTPPIPGPRAAADLADPTGLVKGPDIWGFRPREQWFYAAIALVLVASVAAPLSWVMNGPIACPTRLIFARPCPGCGLTRALALMGHGEWGSAWGHNPFGAALWVGLGVLLIGRGWQRWSGSRPSLFPRGVFATGWMRAVLVLWLGWGLWRMATA